MGKVMLKIYDLIGTVAWKVYKFCDKRTYNIIRKDLMDKAHQRVLWQDFFEDKPSRDFNDVFIEDDEEL